MISKQVYERISVLAAKQFLGIITPPERASLEKWLAQDDGNREIYENITARLGRSSDKIYLSKKENRKAWKELAAMTGHRLALRRALRYSAAAAVIAGAVLLGYNYLTDSDEVTPVIKVTTPYADASSDKVRMIRPDETVFTIEPGNDYFATGEDGTLPGHAVMGTIDNDDLYSTIIVPRGHTLKAVIADDIKVWFNSESEISYQANPSGEYRNIYVSGEVFIETGKLTKPLIVHPGNGISIKVLGTSFNVNSYEGSGLVTTTLVTGRLEITGPGSDISFLEPSQQLEYNLSENSLTKREVDTHLYTAWIEDRFVFQNETLEKIMERVSRWYNVDISYSDDSLRGIRYTGDLDRYEDITTLLDMLEKVTRIKIDFGSGVNVKPRE